ncbi:unnamed protein product [Spirodela intermedia]|uniref:Uncharacterized protein n=1 Tax=Spirodela intermedia TaxID=51605 RepID=A0A7I8JXY8_SPIIN|nr:unnamed protein product [Spirodela intermedia]
MGKIKPQALLQQSKKKKGPARISLSSIIACNFVVIVIGLSLYAAYKHWYRRLVSFVAISFVLCWQIITYGHFHGMNWEISLVWCPA